MKKRVLKCFFCDKRVGGRKRYFVIEDFSFYGYVIGDNLLVCIKCAEKHEYGVICRGCNEPVDMFCDNKYCKNCCVCHSLCNVCGCFVKEVDGYGVCRLCRAYDNGGVLNGE